MSDAENSMATGSFYGVKNKRKWIGIERSIDEVVKKHQAEKIPKPFPNSIGHISGQIYSQRATVNSMIKTMDLHVFAFESESFEGNTGQRLYLTSSYPVFWHYYKQMDLIKRHHYEVIPQGSLSKLYFDLEYDKTVNPDRDGDNMVNLFIQTMCIALEKEFKIKCSRSDVLDLEASTEKKFSRHLIFQTGQAVFKNNVHAGNFVLYVMSGILNKIERSKDKPNCGNKTSTTQDEETRRDVENMEYKTCNTDKDVASDKSNTMSTKVWLDEDGQSDEKTDKEYSSENIDSSVKPCQSDLIDGTESADSVNGNIIQEKQKVGDFPTDDKLADILLSFTAEELSQMIVKNKHEEDVLFCDTGVYTKNRNFRLYLSSKLNKNNALVLSPHNTYQPRQRAECMEKEEALFYDSLVSNVTYTNKIKVLSFGDDEEKRTKLSQGHKSKSGLKEETLDGYSKSPYPEVDEYITGLITQNGNRGAIRHWTYFNLGEILLYEISHYRFCHNIGRPHRSNNIMYIVDLRRGVFYQKCHDPDCHTQNYKSEEWILPRHILPESFFDDDDLDQEMDDQELLNSTLELEHQYKTEHANRNNSDLLDDGIDDYLLAVAGQIENC